MAVKDADINRYLDATGIKHSHIGYRYLLAAIQLGTKSPKSLIKITDLYQKIALNYETEVISVERAIRYAVSPLNLTNKEFITKAVDDINCGLKAGRTQ